MLRYATLLLLVAALGCSSDESPTSAGSNACGDPWPTANLWVTRGGCEETQQATFNGSGTLQFNAGACTLTLDVTPAAEKAIGGQWILTANLRDRTASVARTGGTCPATDTGSLRVETTAVVASFRAAAMQGCNCRLNYTINVPRPR